jgi:amidase
MRKVQHEYDAALREVDFLIMPTCVTPSSRYPLSTASPLEQSNAALGKLENTSSLNGTGHPALAMPIGFVAAQDDAELRLPASLQIVGRYWDELGILKVAYAWEMARDWRTL